MWKNKDTIRDCPSSANSNIYGLSLAAAQSHMTASKNLLRANFGEMLGNVSQFTDTVSRRYHGANQIQPLSHSVSPSGTLDVRHMETGIDPQSHLVRC